MEQVFNIQVPIPNDLVLVKKDDYVDLLTRTEEGVWWTIDDVEKLLGMKRTKLINDILLKPEIKKEIDIELSSYGFVVYPKTKGSPYRFLASKTRKYFEENFGAILLVI